MNNKMGLQQVLLRARKAYPDVFFKWPTLTFILHFDKIATKVFLTDQKSAILGKLCGNVTGIQWFWE